MGTNLKTRLVVDAMNMAIGQPKPFDVIHHSDQGSQCTSVAFGHAVAAPRLLEDSDSRFFEFRFPLFRIFG